MPERVPRVLSLTKEQAEKKYRKAASLYIPLTFEGDLIKKSIIDKNRLAAETNPRISNLIGLYVSLNEYALTGASPTGQLAREWISLVGYSCELILIEGKHQLPGSFDLLRGMFEDIYRNLKGLSQQKPRHVFKSLAFVIGESLRKNGIKFSANDIERRLKHQYEGNRGVEGLVKLTTFLPWLSRR